MGPGQALMSQPLQLHTFVVITTQRSGSTFLTNALGMHKNTTYCSEIFVRKEKTKAVRLDLQGAWSLLQSRARSRERSTAVGFKLMMVGE